MFETFYHGSIRNTVIAFGSLFNEIYVVRKDRNGVETSRFKVPITYAPKEKFYRMLNEYSALKDGSGPEISTILPRIGFNIETITYDESRKRNTLSRRYKAHPTDVDKISYDYAAVPYNIEFFLTISSRTMEDGLQIIEQILPYFTPEFTVTVNFTDHHQRIDVPITLLSVDSQTDFEGDTSQARSVSFNMSFSAKSYAYGPIKESKIIKTVDATFFDADFDERGNVSITGGTAAVARIFVGVTGPSGADSGILDYTASPVFGSTTDRANTIFEYPNTLDTSGNTLP